MKSLVRGLMLVTTLIAADGAARGTEPAPRPKTAALRQDVRRFPYQKWCSIPSPAQASDHFLFLNRCLSPDGQCLAGTSYQLLRTDTTHHVSQDGPARVYALALGTAQELSLHQEPARHHAFLGFTPESHLLAAQYHLHHNGSYQIAIVNLSTGQHLARIPGGHVGLIGAQHQERFPNLNRAVLSPDHKCVAVVGRERVTLWNVRTGEQRGAILRSSPLSIGNLGPVAFSPESERLAVGDTQLGRGEPGQQRAAVYLCRATTGQLDRTLDCPFPVQALSFSPSGEHLAILAGPAPGIISLWDVERGESKTELRLPAEAGVGLSVAYSPNGQHIVCSCASSADCYSRRMDRVIVWDTATRQAKVQPCPEHTLLAFSPDSRQLVAFTARTRTLVWTQSAPKEQP